MEETISSLGTFSSPVKSNSRLGDFKILSRLGEGSFSTVYKVERQTDRRIYALKKVRLSRLSEKEKASALNEIRILASIRNEHVIEYKESFFDESSESLCIVMEYAGCGDLLAKLNAIKAENLIVLGEQPGELEEEEEQLPQSDNLKLMIHAEMVNDRKLDQFPTPQKEKPQITTPFVYMAELIIWQYIYQMTQGLRCLHELGIIHRDLKCANLLLDSSNHLKIGDLNVSVVRRINNNSGSVARTQTGTPYYTAPEIWKGQPYSEQSDIWSIGCIIYELCAQQPPFKGTSIEGLFLNILKGEFLRIPKCYSDDLASLASACLSQISSQRPSCEEILKIAEGARKNKFFLKQSISSSPPPQTPQKAIIQGDRLLKQKMHLIDTIVIPSNMKRLEGMLPRPNYDDNRYETQGSQKVTTTSKYLTGSSARARKDISESDRSLGVLRQKNQRSREVSKFEDIPAKDQDLRHLVISPFFDLPSLSSKGDAFLVQSKFDCTTSEQQKQSLQTNIGQNNSSFQYHDLIRDSPIRLNLQKVPMNQSKILSQVNKSFQRRQPAEASFEDAKRFASRTITSIAISQNTRKVRLPSISLHNDQQAQRKSLSPPQNNKSINNSSSFMISSKESSELENQKRPLSYIISKSQTSPKNIYQIKSRTTNLSSRNRPIEAKINSNSTITRSISPNAPTIIPQTKRRYFPRGGRSGQSVGVEEKITQNSFSPVNPSHKSPQLPIRAIFTRSSNQQPHYQSISPPTTSFHSQNKENCMILAVNSSRQPLKANGYLTKNDNLNLSCSSSNILDVNSNHHIVLKRFTINNQQKNQPSYNPAVTKQVHLSSGENVRKFKQGGYNQQNIFSVKQNQKLYFDNISVNVARETNNISAREHLLASTQNKQRRLHSAYSNQRTSVHVHDYSENPIEKKTLVPKINR